jgi:hypothetical protein
MGRSASIPAITPASSKKGPVFRAEAHFREGEMLCVFDGERKIRAEPSILRGIFHMASEHIRKYLFLKLLLAMKFFILSYSDSFGAINVENEVFR